MRRLGLSELRPSSRIHQNFSTRLHNGLRMVRAHKTAHMRVCCVRACVRARTRNIVTTSAQMRRLGCGRRVSTHLYVHGGPLCVHDNAPRPKINELYRAAGETRAPPSSRRTGLRTPRDVRRAASITDEWCAHAHTLFVSTNIRTREIYTSQSRH